MRTISISYTIHVEMSVPDDFPVTAEDVQKHADWKNNDYCDGRHPFSTELMHDGAERAAETAIAAAISTYACRKVEKWFGNINSHIEGRNALESKWAKSVHYLHQSGELGV